MKAMKTVEDGMLGIDQLIDWFGFSSHQLSTPIFHLPCIIR